MSRNLDVASALLFVAWIVGVFIGLQHLLLLAPRPEELPTVSQIRGFSPELVDFIEFTTIFEGLYLLTAALTLSVISLIPYRNGEKWAWYATLVIGGIILFGLLILFSIVPFNIARTFLPLGVILTVLWIAGLALPAKEILGKPSS
ncbi:MAG: hypothetical protein ACE5R6_21930 [Candidatus Heimdallarchaeota archaeon]